MANGHRLPYVDSLKGFAILLVVLGHVLQHYYSDEILIVRIVYAFHIPMFMFMSGYVCYMKYEWSMVRRRAVQLLVPFFSSIILSYGINVWLGTADETLPVYLWNVVLQPDRGLWFLWALFFISILFIGCRRISQKLHLPEWPVFVLVAVLLNGMVIFGKFRLFGFHWIAWYFIYFYAGVVWRKWNESRDDTHRFDIRLLISCAMLFLLMVCFFRMHNEAPTFYRWINLGPLFPVAYRFAIGLIGTLMVYEIFKLYYKSSLIQTILSKMGGVTLGIYYIHFLILQIIFFTALLEKYPVIGSCLYTLVATYVSYVLSRACLRYDFSSLLIMGKWTKKKLMVKPSNG